MDDRVVVMSAQGYKKTVKPKNGKGFHWTCDVSSELPVKKRDTGFGSERPMTMCELF